MNQRLKELRLMIGWNQFDLAKQSGVGRTRVSLFENGHVELQPAEVARISAALHRAAADRVLAIGAISTDWPMVPAAS